MHYAVKCDVPIVCATSQLYISLLCLLCHYSLLTRARLVSLSAVLLLLCNWPWPLTSLNWWLTRWELPFCKHTGSHITIVTISLGGSGPFKCHAALLCLWVELQESGSGCKHIHDSVMKYCVVDLGASHQEVVSASLVSYKMLSSLLFPHRSPPPS